MSDFIKAVENVMKDQVQRLGESMREEEKRTRELEMEIFRKRGIPEKYVNDAPCFISDGKETIELLSDMMCKCVTLKTDRESRSHKFESDGFLKVEHGPDGWSVYQGEEKLSTDHNFKMAIGLAALKFKGWTTDWMDGSKDE